MTHSDLYDFMRTSKLAVLSSISTTAGNSPQGALIGIAVTRELEVVFDTVKSTRKYPNLIASPACSLVFGLEGPATLQYEGVAEELSGDRLEHYRNIYFETWPDGPERLTWPGITHFLVTPRWIRYSDFAQTPPLIREYSFG